MPSAGALPAPFITPIHRDCHGLQLPVNKIDSSTLIELSSDVPNCKLYFTTDGSKPLPFQRKIGGKERTFKYFAPFTLKCGKRTLKAVAVSRDGLLESAVVSKDFNVVNLDSLGTSEGYESSTSAATLQSFLDESSDGEYNLKPGKVQGLRPRRTKSPSRKKTVPKEAWASSLYQDPSATGASNEGGYPPVPEGPFNPTNYSGTQINVWGAPPGSWPGMNANNGMVTFGNAVPQNPVQYGFLTEQMIRGLKQKEQPKPEPQESLTLGDIRKLMEETKPKTPPPAIEYKPVWKDPPLNPVSPGNEDYQGNILHIYAHMLDMAKSKASFKKNIGEYKMGKILEAKVEDEGDGYRLNIVLAKPGTQRGLNKKAAK
ncbi:uncharacterized protein LOC101851128, partial [Aplysia californica]|uniref:Uncharacterized protein LOC101851128 n=1 Tax=Aplysia californica TaxID=6500 RepID=A0ABM1A0G7_APLCA